MGGTPAYMAPEMAAGPIDAVGYHSDVYLLGAVLFEIVTGRAAHNGKDVMTCLLNAAKNAICPVEQTGELMEIALRAMATKPDDRYTSVVEFQNAIREYQAHSESVALTERMIQDFSQARASGDYQDFARVIFGFEEALAMWGGNRQANEELRNAKLAYAQRAFDMGDFDLGLSILDPEDDQHAELMSQLRQARQQVFIRSQRLKWARHVLIGTFLLSFASIVAVPWLYLNASKWRRSAEMLEQKVNGLTNRLEELKSQATPKP